MNVRICLITDVIVLIVYTRLRLPPETLLKGMQVGMQLWLNFITNVWARLATRYGWASPLLPGLPKQHLLTLRPLRNSNFPCNVRACGNG